MARYMTAHIDFFSNDLTMKEVEAESREQAMLKRLGYEGTNTDDIPLYSVEEIKQFAFDCDSMVDAIQI